MRSRMRRQIAVPKPREARRVTIQEAVNYLTRLRRFKEGLEAAAAEEKPSFDMSKLDQLEDLLDKAKKDIRKPPASIDPKEYWALIIKNLRDAVEELIKSEGLDATDTGSEPTFESDLPLPASEDKPQIDGDEGTGEGEEEEDNSLAEFLGSEGSEDSEGSEGSEGEEDKNESEPKQESFTAQVRAMFSSRAPLSWEVLTKQFFPGRGAVTSKTLQERRRVYHSQLKRLRSSLREESAANLADGLAYLAAMVKGATTNQRLAKAGEELFQTIAQKSKTPEEGVVVPFLKKLGINIDRESYSKAEIEVPMPIKNKLISLATGAPRAKEALSKVTKITLDRFAEIAYQIALVTRKKKTSENPDWEQDE